MAQIIPFEVRKVKNCRTACAFFIEKENACPYYAYIDADDPSFVHPCLEYTEATRDYSFLEEHVMGSDDFSFQIQGDSSLALSLYPYSSDLPLRQQVDGLVWYTSPGNLFGAWVLQEAMRPMAMKQTSVKQGWAKYVYQSPIPLHDHVASATLCSRICWYIDDDGYGQYTLIVGGQIKMISHPRPENWLE